MSSALCVSTKNTVASSVFQDLNVFKWKITSIKGPVFFRKYKGGYCVCVGIDHMAPTHGEIRPMIKIDDNFIPHHMYLLKISTSLLCPAAVPGPPQQNPLRSQSQSVTST